ncbi:unnamed protein product [Lactuca saligna]|uniref:Uncharacterized protein n=1 Tax=Lactuca saligna TaxID=75948 RepID=A0AA36A1A9_LACSI|nr:unnamed protein product [Lactuca saligna]
MDGDDPSDPNPGEMVKPFFREKTLAAINRSFTTSSVGPPSDPSLIGHVWFLEGPIQHARIFVVADVSAKCFHCSTTPDFGVFGFKQRNNVQPEVE